MASSRGAKQLVRALLATAAVVLWLCYQGSSDYAVLHVHAQEEPTDTTASALLDVPEQSGVLLLSQPTFVSALQTSESLFVLFDAPARRGSLELFRAFAHAAVVVRETSPTRMRFGAMDVLEPSSLPDRLGVIGLPALVRFECPRNVDSRGCTLDAATITHYTGGRTSAELQRFMSAQPRRELLVVRDDTALQALVTTQPVVVLAVIDGVDTQPYFDALALAQTDASASAYAVTTNRSLLLPLDTTVPTTGSPMVSTPSYVPALVVFQNFGATHESFTGAWHKRALVQFVQRRQSSTVSVYTSAFPRNLFDASARAHVLVFADTTAHYYSALLDQTQALAHQYADVTTGPPLLKFVLVPASERALRDAFFVGDALVPTVVVVEDVDAAPLRLALFGAALIDALADETTLQYYDALSALLIDKFPRVLVPSDATDSVDSVDDDDGSDDVSSQREVDTSSSRRLAAYETAISPDDAGFTEDTGFAADTGDGDDGTNAIATRSVQPRDIVGIHRELSVVIADDSSNSALPTTSTASATSALSPWELHRQQQQQSLVRSVADVHWILAQQAASDRALVVTFASPRCFACRTFANVLEQAARATAALPAGNTCYDDSAAVVFATVNVDAVDTAALGLQLTQLPSVFVYPRGAGAAAVQLTARSVSLAALLAFVASNC